MSVALNTLTQFHTLARQVVAEAAALLLASVGGAIASRKDDGTLVTQMDHAADEHITQTLQRAFPDHAILSEERNTRFDPSVRYTWVLDPLDGTTNFARGLTIWGVSLALLEWGEPVVGVLNFPSLREEFHARRDGGAWLNEQSIHTSDALMPDDQHFLMCCTRTARHFTVNTPLKPRIFGSTAYHLAALAHGAALATVEATPKLWDVAAALLILREAGGHYALLNDDQPLFPLPYAAREFNGLALPLLAAANQALLAELRRSITPRFN